MANVVTNPVSAPGATRSMYTCCVPVLETAYVQSTPIPMPARNALVKMMAPCIA
jgi:hypothetical protein